MKIVNVLYNAFCQAQVKTPRKLEKSLARLETIGKELPKESRREFEDVLSAYYEAAESLGFRAGFQTAWDLWRESTR